MIEIFECEQGSPEWYQCRLGIPTASEFDAVLAKGRDGKSESKTRRTYLLKLVGERITGEPMWNYKNEHHERGKEMEAEARDLYAFMTDEEPQRIGFIRNGQVGASPDSLISSNGLLEVKTKLAHLQAEVLLADELPSEHKAQVQGQLLVSEREFVDFVSYWPRMPLFVKRICRDESYIKQLKAALDVFLTELDTMHKVVAGKILKVA